MIPTKNPTTAPTNTPTKAPTIQLTKIPSIAPTVVPTRNPSPLVSLPIGNTTIVDAKFTGGSLDGFSYRDGTFRGTSNSSQYANGGTQTTADNRDVVFVRLGGIDDNDVYGISGGWSRSFLVAYPSNVTISIVFQLTVTRAFEYNEVSEVLCSLDGQIIMNGLVEYLARLSGDGDRPGIKTTGFRRVNLTATNVESGIHTIVVGGHLTRKTFRNEVAFILFDEVQVRVSESTNRALLADVIPNSRPNLRRRTGL
jgi:hypothetical protein